MEPEEIQHNFMKEKGFNVSTSFQEYLGASYSFTGGQL